jgi:hypothetical protein
MSKLSGVRLNQFVVKADVDYDSPQKLKAPEVHEIEVHSSN